MSVDKEDLTRRYNQLLAKLSGVQEVKQLDYKVILGSTSVVLFLGLILVTPSFVTEKKMGKRRLSYSKVFMWWIIFTLLIVAGYYLFEKYKNVIFV